MSSTFDPLVWFFQPRAMAHLKAALPRYPFIAYGSAHPYEIEELLMKFETLGPLAGPKHEPRGARGLLIAHAQHAHSIDWALLSTKPVEGLLFMDTRDELFVAPWGDKYELRKVLIEVSSAVRCFPDRPSDFETPQMKLNAELFCRRAWALRPSAKNILNRNIDLAESSRYPEIEVRVIAHQIDRLHAFPLCVRDIAMLRGCVDAILCRAPNGSPYPWTRSLERCVRTGVKTTPLSTLIARYRSSGTLLPSTGIPPG
ncbi:hypothetical protein [Sinimarinibacterium flocculans]|uniref:Uncharacterized protein n=1 Tax=Sinimarinibacterium flocculans TaxID=985250 RepID=A0A318EKF3_9GAMM|nr:hypothetical protein [Sinimarinibacterium flocculans]PXV71555.1 hypothetical protein C8D93_101607 [Sinimarinibacterium flocculans]